ncbi:hypothetical protein BKA69DRAFT_1175908 [Paraphysoderma sedebokerense]|nr:hypothetical protein BKA69DRAFT_1175908 [Paraphysoderma sedebokerense]
MSRPRSSSTSSNGSCNANMNLSAYNLTPFLPPSSSTHLFKYSTPQPDSYMSSYNQYPSPGLQPTNQTAVSLLPVPPIVQSTVPHPSDHSTPFNNLSQSYNFITTPISSPPLQSSMPLLPSSSPSSSPSSLPTSSSLINQNQNQNISLHHPLLSESDINSCLLSAAESVARRRESNRRSQEKYRERRKIYVKRLESKISEITEQSEKRVRNLESENKELKEKIKYLESKLGMNSESGINRSFSDPLTVNASASFSSLSLIPSSIPSSSIPSTTSTLPPSSSSSSLTMSVSCI